MTLKAHTQELLLAIQRETEELISRANRSGARDLKPATGGWSMVEVLEHLAKVAEGTLSSVPQIPKTIQTPPLSKRLFRHLGSLVLKTPFKVKAPPMVNPDGAPFDDVVQRLRAANTKLEEFFNTTREEHLHNHVFFHHPYFGDLSLIDGLKFLRTHLKHHFFQFRRIESEMGARGSEVLAATSMVEGPSALASDSPDRQ